jgi:hypothetical protein
MAVITLATILQAQNLAGVGISGPLADNPRWYKYSVVAIANGTNGCANANGCWQTNTVLGANKAAGLTQNLSFVTLPVKTFINAVFWKTATACTGTTTLVLNEVKTATGLLISQDAWGYDLKAAVSDTNTVADPMSICPTPGNCQPTSSMTLDIELVSTVENIDQTAVGCAVDVWVLWGVLP